MVEAMDVWSALAHPARRRLVDRLRSGPASTGDLVEVLADHDQSSRFTTLRHLKTLRDAGLVTTEEQGRERRNFLNGSALYQATIGWLDPPSRAAATALDRLKTAAETPLSHPDATGVGDERTAMTDFQSFEISQQIHIAADRDRVWTALTGDVGAWWGSPYLLIERPGSRLTVEPRIGAPVTETNGAEQRVWGTISSLDPGRLLGWTGPMGMGSLAWGTVEFTLADADTNTDAGEGILVTVTQASFGAFSAEAGAGYSFGWDDLLQRLRAHLVDGRDHGVNGSNRAVG